MFSVTAFILGLVSSVHCIGMCGPIVLALPYNNANSKWWFGPFAYNLGRIFTYSVLGFLLGWLGRGFYTADLQKGLSIVIGIFMILGAIAPSLSKKFSWGQQLSQTYIKYLGKPMRKAIQQPNSISFLVLGLLNGLLPCGMVYAALAGAVSSNGPLTGSVFMASFGLGTFTLMFLLSLGAQKFSPVLRNRLQKLVPFILFLFGAWFILRGLNLNIPYLSPFIDRVTYDVTTCHG